jgi:RES domain-containing protein
MKTDRVAVTDESICLEHVEDIHLLRALEQHSAPGDCVLCESNHRLVVNLELLAQLVLAAIEKRFDHWGFIPDEKQFFAEVPLTELADSVSQGAFQERFRLSLVEKLVSLIDSDDPWFERYDEDAHAGTYFAWRDFEHRVKHQSRLLLAPVGEKAMTPPEENYELARSMVDFVSDHPAYIETLEPGTYLYRARTGANLRDLHRRISDNPKLEIGPPPAEAASPARLSAAGIPMLYTATEPDTACAEVTSHSHYRECIVASIRVEQPLRILNLSAIPEPVSIFDAAYTSRATRLRDFEFYRDRMTQAVTGDDQQAIEYLPSQLLTEAFRWWSSPHIHGIAYPSTAWKGGQNVALFFEDWEWIEATGRDFYRFGMPSKPNSPMRDEFEERPVLTVDVASVRQYEVETTIAVVRSKS